MSKVNTAGFPLSARGRMIDEVAEWMRKGLVEQAMKPSKQTELMDEDEYLSRNGRGSWRGPLLLTLGI